ANFQAEKKTGFEAVTFGRERWDRGLERKPRPSRAWLLRQLLPEPDTESAQRYAETVATNAATLLFRLSPAAGYVGFASEPLTAGADAERLLNPWRLQYLTQEQLDGYSGRYFLPIVPTPEQAIDLGAVPKKFGGGSGPKTLNDLRRDWTTLR